MVSCNCPVDRGRAIAVCRSLEDCHLTWIEEPVWPPEDHCGLARVRAEGASRAAGENVARGGVRADVRGRRARLCATQRDKTGASPRCWRFIAAGTAAGVHVVPHSAYFGRGCSPSIHVCAAAGRGAWVERFYCDFEENPLGEAINPKAAASRAQGPGLGSIRPGAPRAASLARLKPDRGARR